MKKFAISGPIRPEQHYSVANRLDFEYLKEHIDDKNYFVLHAPRQTGKTTEIKHLVEKLN